MSVQNPQPRYMAKLLEELGWNQGTRIPLANPENQVLENILIDRQNEIQRLKEALILQKQKREDLNKYKANVQTEYQENTRILFSQKHQLEQEVKLRQLAVNEADRLERDIIDCQKKAREMDSHTDRYQGSIAKLLKRADSLKTEVCGERGALQEWRAAIERKAGDIDAIEQFTKQDISKFKALDYQRQKVKVEHDQVHDRLTQLMSNLTAEERACERISQQVLEGIEQRRVMMKMWTDAVENLRNRDMDIRHIREDYAVLEEEANKVAEQCREHQAFCDQQTGNNLEAERENAAMAHRLGNLRQALTHLLEANVTLDSEMKSLIREQSNIQGHFEKLRAENHRIMKLQGRKDTLLSQTNQKIRELKIKLTESLDKSKSAEKRAKQLEEMLNEEERYASNMTQNQQRAMHCSFLESQKLLELKNEEKLFHIQQRATKAILCKLDSKQADMEKKLQSLKESIYVICYQVETVGARVMHMEGDQAERECRAELVEKENRLKEVLGRHAARVALLERHSARLHDDMRRLTREIEVESAELVKMQSRLKTSMLTVDGGSKELKSLREQWRRDRVEEALLRLRVEHASRAVASIEDTNFTLDKQRLQLDAAMNERLVEIGARKDMFVVQKRALEEDCGKLKVQIREREQRVVQLVKRYDIFIASLGKEDSGEQMSVTYFKIKFAAERAELREQGAALDADIGRRERDVSALEATMRVVAAAHAHFMHHMLPLADDTPEIEEVKTLTKKYYEICDELKQIRAAVAALEERVNELSSKRENLADKNKQLIARENEAESELENARDRLQKQETRLQNAHDIIKHYLKRAKKLIEGVDEWRIFQLALWVRDYAESHHNALNAIQEVCSTEDSRARLAALLAATDLQKHMLKSQRRMQLFVQRFIAESSPHLKGTDLEIEDSMFSTSEESSRSGMSLASGFTQRFAAFRQTLARKVQEPAMMDEIVERDRSQRPGKKENVLNLGVTEYVPASRPADLGHYKGHGFVNGRMVVNLTNPGFRIIDIAHVTNHYFRRRTNGLTCSPKHRIMLLFEQGDPVCNALKKLSSAIYCVFTSGDSGTGGIFADGRHFVRGR